MDFRRYLQILEPLKRKSVFLFGPRSVGKTYWMRKHLPTARAFNLLDSDIYSRFLRRPRQLGEEILAPEKLVIIDEIQKIPSLLDEVHRLIEERDIKFLLTGSSARKLKRGGANLLGGRATWLEMFPLVSDEIPDFKLLPYLQRGGIPRIYLSNNAREDFSDYVNLYMKEEIREEALVRKIDHFARFLDVIGLQSGEELNYQNIANDAGVPPRTVANFIEILKDTLLAFEVTAFSKSKKRKAITRSKIFLFDVGLANHLAERRVESDRTPEFGKAFEHFIAQELRAYLSYRRRSEVLSYWRTTNQIEVDFVVGNKVAIEVKSTHQIQDRDLKGLKALAEEKMIHRLVAVSLDPEKRIVGSIEILPWRIFLSLLWKDKLF